MGNKTKIITAIIPIIIFGITLWWYLNIRIERPYRAFSIQMLKEDCFGVDAQWTENNELLNDPKVFDCRQRYLGRSQTKLSWPGSRC